MGQCISVPNRKLSLMREGSTKRFYRSKNGNLSATFHVLDSDQRWDLLNINSATEEQLMTLPGINRVTAENIVEYRQRIGGFKKVEDLALVSGVGATKLEQFRTEICVARRKGNGSYNSSVTQSLESLTTNEIGARSSPSKLVNVNTANVFQLMSVCRMTQEMAANIVHYRERKGPFKTLDDLSKVKGLPPDRLAIVKMYLTVDSSKVNYSSSLNSKISQNCVYGRRPVGHRRTNSAPSGLEKTRSCDPSTKDFYELVSSLVTRPPVSEVFNFNYIGRQVLRLASWNLQEFVVEKAKNPGVQEVMCRTILENGFSLVAVQEVASREALSLIASELNEPKLYPIQEWKRDRGKWHSLVPSIQNNGDNSHKKTLMNGFLYDTSRGLQLQESTVLYIPPEKLVGLSVTCQPFLGSFKVENMDFTVVTFSLISESCVIKLLPSILEQLKERIQGNKNVFLIGDFILPPGHTVFEVLNSQGYTNLIPIETSVNNGNWQEESHIWSSMNVRKIYTGQSGVVSEGLSHLAIPDGWKWGGSVSKHCPVWAEMFRDEDATSSAVETLSNGITKTPYTNSEIMDESINALNESNKEKSKGFWERNFTWRYNNKQSISCEKSNNINKENGSL
ncbi:endonuclease/exonuclease/phosphatase family domain-containing protein 1-like [Stegodyphus dumicola]|uniref:endonuclease/exonuclease/phosphatase family domain-containing protein 1-like n=1 Tax=Stegodyphus dumicola TaxID=202533 RepID=UPI0015A7835A|nr:endonuclease/exonuclease/phosphatase family domain-containing protein 1-like [Stegodyphus dumicola]XP_035225696.1 endonuclease/exonuclease/phosphatase family domain-containing protein 1-like [Stegodyphus dumicola]XP_035225697.1 endonuclease/exonuclease/phosphatase family domain-containing protein 1-like [Stegodyphus dumicola]